MNINLDDYPNLLDEISISLNELKTQIKPYHLIFDGYKHKEVEWGMTLPLFLDSFYDLVISKQKVPTQHELWEIYRHHELVKIHLKSNDLERGIKARLNRTYPSLVRDLHFAIYLREMAQSSKVIYNKKLDVEVGIDILLVFKGRYYGINLFISTRRSKLGREKKKFRHKKVANVINIELPIELNENNRWGDFYLYGDQQLSLLREEFRNINNSKK